MRAFLNELEWTWILIQARHNIEEFDLFTLDEVDASFEKITQLKYNQSIQLKGKGQVTDYSDNPDCEINQI